MKNRVFRTTAITALLLSLTACSGYQGITAVHREMDARDNLPAAVQNSNPDLPSDFRLLTEDAGVRYFAAESEDFTRACIAVHPVDKPDQWAIGCSEGITGDREIVTVTHTGQPTAKLVTTGFDTSALESGGWRKIHDNVLIGSATQP
ncbi:hypothetical protein ACIQG8_14540 [Pseudarthrobacter oxydans]|uniref:hypothetical protein n=1 Tax=Pseudarthrobacter oxydans TaxID=1671 RepID=UPI0038226BB9